MSTIRLDRNDSKGGSHGLGISILDTNVMKSLIFFDAGGTLVYPARKIGEFYAEVGREFGQSFDPLRVNEGFKAGFRAFRPRAVETIPTNGDDRLWWRQVVLNSLEQERLTSDFDFDEFYETLYHRFENPEWWKLFPDVLPVLMELQARGTRLAVLSNWDARLHSILNGLGVGHFFEKRFISAEMGFEKPMPEIYRKACEAMKVELRDVCVVGDDEVNDLEMPKRLGMDAYWVSRPERTLEGVL